MPQLHVDIAHAVGAQEAKRRIVGRLSELKNEFRSWVSEIREEWTGYTGVISLVLKVPLYGRVPLRGVIKISATDVTVTSDPLPPVFIPYRTMAEQKIHAHLKKLLNA